MEKKTIEFEVFKAGTHTDSEGDTKSWTQEDIETIVNTYNERIKEDPGAEAPIVKGHPETDDPAFGWVKSLKVEDDKIVATAEINSTFADEVSDELYKKVSIALYPDLMLRHIGFLGAAQPAVKGLEPVKFNRKDKFKYFMFEDIAPTDNTIESIKASQQERAKKFGISVKDNIGYIEKPPVYSSLTDEQFADPVNYLYPIHDKANWLASWKMWDMWDNREQYKNIERQIILARFIGTAEGMGIEVDKKIYFNEESKGTTLEFSIPLKENLKRDKPEAWKEYATDDFGDPTHYRFPLKTKSEVKASMAIFSRKNVTEQYDEKERQYIASRIIRAAQNNGISPTPSTWAYVDIPADMLTKNQLLELVKQTENKSFNNPKGINMDEYLQGLAAYLIQKVSEAVNEETATQLQTWIDEYKAQNPLPASEPAQQTGTQASEPQIPKEYAEKISRLEKENRQMKFNDYVGGLLKKGKIVPTMKDSLLNLLEATHDKSYEFTENGKSKENYCTGYVETDD